MCFRLPDHEYLFGRVVEEKIGLMEAMLYYIYRVVTITPDPEPVRDRITVDHLLTAPFFAPPLQSSGLGPVVAHWDLHSEDRLQSECFLDYVRGQGPRSDRVYDAGSGTYHFKRPDGESGYYRDVHANHLDTRTAPVGEWHSVLFPNAVEHLIWTTIHAAPPGRIIRVPADRQPPNPDRQTTDQ